MADPPDCAIGVLRHQQRAVMGDRNTDRPSPDAGIVDHEARDKVLVFAGGDTVLHANTNDLVAGTFRPVPRAVLRGKAVSGIFRWKLVAVIEGQPERRRMRLKQHVGYRDLALEVGAFAAMLGILIIADIKPRPAIERAFAHPIT